MDIITYTHEYAGWTGSPYPCVYPQYQDRIQTEVKLKEKRTTAIMDTEDTHMKI